MTGPTRDGVLGAQVAHELAELKQLSDSLEAVLSARSGTDQAVRNRFDRLINGLQAKLAPIPDADAWTELATLRRSIAEIKQEALAFVQGVLLREKSLDNGIGVVSERLLAELLERTGEVRRVLLALSDNEFFKHTVSMVRGRFPDVSVWNLPVLVHELGHHVAATLAHADPALREEDRPVMTYLSEEADNETSFAGVERAVALAHLHELFADVYATYVLGAAYPLNLITLGASPDVFGASSRTHPSWSRRVHTIRAVAEALGAGGVGAAGYRDLANTISRIWREIAGADDSTEDERAVAELQAGEMVKLLAEHAFPLARYGMPERVNEIVIDPDQPLVALDDDVTLTDMLNAAWRWRIENWGSPGWLIDGASRRALELTQQMIR